MGAQRTQQGGTARLTLANAVVIQEDFKHLCERMAKRALKTERGLGHSSVGKKTWARVQQRVEKYFSKFKYYKRGQVAELWDS